MITLDAILGSTGDGPPYTHRYVPSDRLPTYTVVTLTRKNDPDRARRSRLHSSYAWTRRARRHR